MPPNTVPASATDYVVHSREPFRRSIHSARLRVAHLLAVMGAKVIAATSNLEGKGQ
jgi:hypothetical protein